MTCLATMGTSSCATIALQGFKDEDYHMNEKYLADTSSFVPTNKNVDWFYGSILYPTKQDLGRTDSMPFTYLMERIKEHHKLNRKFLIATLNGYQVGPLGKGYWIKQLKEWDFKHMHSTINSIGGGRNYVFVRDLAVTDTKLAEELIDRW